MFTASMFTASIFRASIFREKTMPAKAKTEPQIDHEAQYRVTLAKAIKVGRSTVVGPKAILRGNILASALASDSAAISSYEPL